MSELWTRQFWLATLERAIKSFAGGMLAVFGGDALQVVNLDWGQAFTVSVMAALSSVLLSIMSAGVGSGGGPSLGPETLKSMDRDQ